MRAHHETPAHTSRCVTCGRVHLDSRPGRCHAQPMARRDRQYRRLRSELRAAESASWDLAVPEGVDQRDLPDVHPDQFWHLFDSRDQYRQVRQHVDVVVRLAGPDGATTEQIRERIGIYDPDLASEHWSQAQWALEQLRRRGDIYEIDGWRWRHKQPAGWLARRRARRAAERQRREAG